MYVIIFKKNASLSLLVDLIVNKLYSMKVPDNFFIQNYSSDNLKIIFEKRRFLFTIIIFKSKDVFTYIPITC